MKKHIRPEDYLPNRKLAKTYCIEYNDTDLLAGA
jgi:hypothetical protein